LKCHVLFLFCFHKVTVIIKVQRKSIASKMMIIIIIIEGRPATASA
jgi:hypothetical protein